MDALPEELSFAALSIWRGFRNGLFYGTKIRLPHALVMTLLFRRSSDIFKMADPIARLTWEHSRNLALFAGFYKTLLALIRVIRVRLGDKITAPKGHPASQLDAFLAAALVSRFVWARYSSVNYQIVLYLFGRVVIALVKVAAKAAAEREQVSPGSNGMVASLLANTEFDDAYPWLATGIWATVLWLYEYHPDSLQSSLFGSMDFLYHESNKWQGAEDFMPSPATAAVFTYLVVRSMQKK